MDEGRRKAEKFLKDMTYKVKNHSDDAKPDKKELKMVLLSDALWALDIAAEFKKDPGS